MLEDFASGCIWNEMPRRKKDAPCVVIKECHGSLPSTTVTFQELRVADADANPRFITTEERNIMPVYFLRLGLESNASGNDPEKDGTTDAFSLHTDQLNMATKHPFGFFFFYGSDPLLLLADTPTCSPYCLVLDTAVQWFHCSILREALRATLCLQ
jgi:hypothetical protein